MRHPGGNLNMTLTDIIFIVTAIILLVTAIIYGIILWQMNRQTKLLRENLLTSIHINLFTAYSSLMANVLQNKELYNVFEHDPTFMGKSQTEQSKLLFFDLLTIYWM